MNDLHVQVVDGFPRYQYGGYWFSLVEPWPEYRADDRYETDDIFIVHRGDGYYLSNRRYPTKGVAIKYFIAINECLCASFDLVFFFV